MAVSFCRMGIGGGRIGAAPSGDLVLSGSVGSGGVNARPDVLLVQSLLNLVSVPNGGPSRLLAVDGLCGPLTIEVIRRFQSVNLGFTDGRIDPGGRTLARLSVLVPPGALSSPSSPGPSLVSRSSSLGLVASAAPAPPPAAPAGTKPAPLAAAIAATPLAKLWVAAATVHLTGLKQSLIASGGVIFLPSVFDIVNTHFHLDRDPSGIMVNLAKAIRVFSRIATMLSDPATFYREGPETAASKFADAPMGGFDLAEPNHHITIRTQYPDCGPNCQAAMLVHEGAHFCGGLNEIKHFAHEFPIPNGTPQDGSAHDYASMTTDESLRNASSYAAFAIHAFFFQDLRFGLDKKSQ